MLAGVHLNELGHKIVARALLMYAGAAVTGARVALPAPAPRRPRRPKLFTPDGDLIEEGGVESRDLSSFGVQTHLHSLSVDIDKHDEL